MGVVSLIGQITYHHINLEEGDCSSCRCETLVSILCKLQLKE
jgi:hypothetical protein